MSRQASAFILIPALMAGSGWLGLRTARWEQTRNPGWPMMAEAVESPRLSRGSAGDGGADALPAGSLEKADATACAGAWRDIRLLPPEPENRWRALGLFRRWAQVDAEGTLRELKADDTVENRLWPAEETVRQFFMMLAATDPGKA